MFTQNGVQPGSSKREPTTVEEPESAGQLSQPSSIVITDWSNCWTGLTSYLQSTAFLQGAETDPFKF